jgi:hypothetical protein
VTIPLNYTAWDERVDKRDEFGERPDLGMAPVTFVWFNAFSTLGTAHNNVIGFRIYIESDRLFGSVCCAKMYGLGLAPTAAMLESIASAYQRAARFIRDNGITITRVE